VKNFFRPEVRNRLDSVVKFNKLDQMSLRKIVAKFMIEINELLADRGIKLRLEEPVVDLVIDQGYDDKMGARPINRKINELIKVPLSRKILFDKIPAGVTLVAKLVDGKVEFVQHDDNQVVGNDGIIRVDGSIKI
jgi:ATP-dependent Clp protease ATP-binding subunit ClpA